MNDLIIELRELGINISGSLEDQVIKVINDYFNKLQQSQDNTKQDELVKDDTVKSESDKNTDFIQNEPIKSNDVIQNEPVKADNIKQDEPIKNIQDNSQDDNKEIYTGAAGGYVRRAVKHHPTLWQAISKKYNY